ncbi:hypothetical protein ACP0H4_11240 [Pseudomonas aeruginosa]
MNKANECTCPSGDGSLVHPCPAHPAVEQAGANVGHGHVLPRADGVKMRCGGPGLCSECTADASRARAALAQRSEFHQHLKECADEVATWPSYKREALTQPSPKCVKCGGTGEADSGGVHPWGEPILIPCDCETEKAEAERPEVVAVRYEDGTILSAEECGIALEVCAKVQTPLMTVAQHERIVGELRAVIAQLRQHKNDYMDAGQETYRALQNEIREREAEIARLDGLVSGRTAERDAALARVAELERGKVYVEARQCDECQHGGINDSATGVAACHECDWTGPEPEEDRCPGCQRENCMAAACPQCGARYVLVASEEIAAPVAQAQQLNDLDKQCRDDVARALGLRPSQERGFAWSYLLASIKSCVEASEDAAQTQHSVPVAREQLERLVRILDAHNYAKDAEALMALLAAAPAQAQHSVPEGWMLVECGIWTQEQVDEMQKTVARFRNSEFVDNRALAMAVADAGQCKAPEISLAELLAAAPGKEVPQAWLDVQAERRRQVEAEGWTPEHDDEHACDEIAAFACFYAMPPAARDWDTSSTGYGDTLGEAILPEGWEPKTGDRRREMVKACALTLAEIERLDRAGITQSPQPGATTASS